MRWLRVSWRLVALGAETLVFFPVYLVGQLATRPWPATALRWRNFVFRSWSRAILWVLGVEVTVSGEPPEAPFYLV